MAKLEQFERFVRQAYLISDAGEASKSPLHPFDTRNLHTGFPAKVRELFDNGHYSESTFEAFKYIDKEVGRFGKVRESGFKLMMTAFDENNPTVKLTPLIDISHVDEQKGFRFMFAGATLAIRNPRGHEHSFRDDVDTCLDHLAFATLLLRRLEQAGYV